MSSSWKLLLRNFTIFAFLLDIAVCELKALNCDFQTDCCWTGDPAWSFQESSQLNANEFRRTFLVGRSKPPPAGNHIRRINTKEQGYFSSCTFCSADGEVSVEYRNWQSPTSRISLCWSYANDSSLLNDCHSLVASKQSHLNSQQYVVPAHKDIIFQFIIENTDQRIESVVLFDRIRVIHKECHRSSNTVKKIKQGLVPVEPSKIIQEEIDTILATKPKKRISLQELAKTDDRIKQKLLSKNKGTLEKQALPALKIRPLSNQQKKPTVLPNPKSPKEANPLNDLLGEDLVNFLDPNYVSNDDEEEGDDVDYEETPKPKETMKKEKEKHENKNKTNVVPSPPLPSRMGTINTGKVDVGSLQNIVPSLPPPISKSTLIIPRKPLVIKPTEPLSELHRPISMSVPYPCETRGGCLFENGFCSWTAPREVLVSARFQRNNVGYSNFIQAAVPSGEISVLESDTNMQENHMIIFDALEWRLGTRLIGCCFIRNALECPFATPSEAGAVMWQVGKFECPAGTEKLVFICENYGTNEGICGIDNIRLHRSSDLFYMEPCQKKLLPQL